MKIGIMGGTFNPPHLGHKNIIIEAYKSLNLDMVYVIPNNIPSHKVMPKNSPTPQNRLEMCEIMCKSLDFTKVLDIEIVQGGTSYTIDTLRKLENQDDELFLIIGSDSFFSIEKWFEYQEIFKLCSIVVFKRLQNIDLEQHKDYLEQKYGVCIYIIDAKVLEVSSTELRENIKNPMAIEGVEQYIKNLYKE